LRFYICFSNKKVSIIMWGRRRHTQTRRWYYCGWWRLFCMFGK